MQQLANFSKANKWEQIHTYKNITLFSCEDKKICVLLRTSAEELASYKILFDIKEKNVIVDGEVYESILSVGKIKINICVIYLL